MIIRTNKSEHPFVQVDKTGITDKRLSWKARGILCYLLSKPDNWEVNIQNLQNNATDGRDSCRAGLKELEKFGYLMKHQKHNEQGHFKGVEYIVFETPKLREEWEESTANGKPGSGGSESLPEENEAGNGKTEIGKPVSGPTGDGKPVNGGQESGSEDNETANGLSADGKTENGKTVDGLTVYGKSNTNNNINTTIKEGTNKKNLKKREGGDFEPPSVKACTEWLIENKEFEREIAESIAWNFWSFHEQKGWVVGQTKMANWQVALVRSLEWEKNKALISRSGDPEWFNVAQARQCLKVNDLDGQYDFEEIFEEVSEGKFKIRPGKRKLISNQK